MFCSRKHCDKSFCIQKFCERNSFSKSEIRTMPYRHKVFDFRRVQREKNTISDSSTLIPCIKYDKVNNFVSEPKSSALLGPTSKDSDSSIGSLLRTLSSQHHYIVHHDNSHNQSSPNSEISVHSSNSTCSDQLKEKGTSRSGGERSSANDNSSASGSSTPTAFEATVSAASSNVASATSTATKPPYTYIVLIAMAITESAHERATSSEICAYIASKFPYFETKKKDWRSAIKSNLSNNDCFVKVPRKCRGDWKGNFWTLDPTYSDMLQHGDYLRRR